MECRFVGQNVKIFHVYDIDIKIKLINCVFVFYNYAT